MERWMAEEIRQLPEQLALYQKQAQTFLENISEEQFADWAKRAKAKKKDCDAEKISLDEFKAWLKNSFFFEFQPFQDSLNSTWFFIRFEIQLFQPPDSYAESGSLCVKNTTGSAGGRDLSWRTLLNRGHCLWP